MPIWDQGGGPQRTPKAMIQTCSIPFLVVGNIMNPWPKIQNQINFLSTHHFWYQGSHIAHLRPWGAHQNPQTSIHTPGTTLFLLASSNIRKPQHKIVNQTIFYPPLPSVPRGHIFPIWDQEGPQSTPPSNNTDPYNHPFFHNIFGCFILSGNLSLISKT